MMTKVIHWEGATDKFPPPLRDDRIYEVKDLVCVFLCLV